MTRLARSRSLVVFIGATLLVTLASPVARAQASGFHPAPANLGAAVPASHAPARALPYKTGSVVSAPIAQPIAATGTLTLQLPPADASAMASAPTTAVGAHDAPLARVSGTWVTSQARDLAFARAVGPKTGAGVSALHVRVLSAGEAQAHGLSGLVIELSRADSSTASAPVAARLAASALNGYFGGDYAARLRWVQMPATATTPLSTSTAVASSRTGDGATILTPQVGSSPVLLAAQSSPTETDGTGSWGATPLNAAASWQVSAQTGDFSWTYPFRLPPAPAGPTPNVALAYDSQSIDGETGSTNNQPSEVGDGWSLSGAGSIDRVYTPCAVADGTYSQIPGSGDLCWVADNATVSFAGHSGALVHSSDPNCTAYCWKLQGDDSTRVEYLTAAGTNSTYDGDYWRLTTTDGTQYYFGLNRLPGSSTANATNSAWTVPVCGTAQSPCTGSGSTMGPFNQQAWRWNLDYVVDPHGNAEVLYYTNQQNHYEQAGTTFATYDRGGTLNEIDYGLRAGNLFAATAASDKVKFASVNRCETGQPNEPAGACSTGTPAGNYWPDVPWEQNCSASPCSETSPTFWSNTMLSTVTTKYLSNPQGTTEASAYSAVEVWALSHSWPDPGDATKAALELDQIAHSDPGSTIPLPPTVINGGVPTSGFMPNRVDPVGEGLAPLQKRRITSIATESGAVISVAYSAQQCTPTLVASLAPEANTYRCFPAWWTPPPPQGTTTPLPARMDWFHKYVVTTVDNDPYTVGSAAARQETDYIYLGSPAWRFNTAPGMADNTRTWSTWAGYPQVEVRQGDPNSHTNPSDPNSPTLQITTDYTFFQGLDGDPCGSPQQPTTMHRVAGGCAASGTPVQVTSSDGHTSATDSLWSAGRVLETATHLGASVGNAASTTPIVTDTVTVPWASNATATSSRSYTYLDPANGTTYQGTLTFAAYLTGDQTATTTSTQSDGTTRTRIVTTSHDGYGRITQVEDATSDAGTTCTKTSYATNDSPHGAYLINYPSEVAVTDKACAATLTYPDDAISDTSILYDNNTTVGNQVPTLGEARSLQVVASYSGTTAASAQLQITRTMLYDALGRLTSSTDPRTNPAATTTTSYQPSAGGPLAQTVTTNPAGWTTTTTYLPQWGVASSIADANANTTTATYDALGRRSQVWLPNRPQASNPTSPSISYTYTMSATNPDTVATTTITAAGTTTTSYRLFDGLGQIRQTQTPAEGGGTDVVDTDHNASGQVDDATAPWYDTANPSTTIATNTLTLPSQTQTYYDGAGRVTASVLLANNIEAWRTSHTYLGDDRTDTVPPAGGTPTSTYTDSRGHATKLVQYLSSSITGTTETTSYGYNGRGDMTAMTDPAGNHWTWKFNVLGQKIAATDPDTGTTSSSYTNAGDLLTQTTPTGSLTYAYDNLHRKTAEYAGADTTGVQLAGWTYDTASAGLGKPTTSTRYVGGTAGQPGTGTAYQESIAGYSALGAPTSQTTTLGGSTPLSGSYTTSYSYTPNGGLASQSDPAAGSLPAEQLILGYDQLGNPDGLSSTTGGSYLTSVSYSHLGQVAQTYQDQGAQVWRTFNYDQTTLRLSELLTQRSATSNAVVSDDTYTYDNAGDLTRDSNATPATGTDTQCYSYDHQQNLTQAWTPASNDCSSGPDSTTMLGGPAPYWTGYTVDPATGNRTQSVEYNAPTGRASSATTDSYAYPPASATPNGTGAGGPNAVSAVTHTTGPLGSGYVAIAPARIVGGTVVAAGATLSVQLTGQGSVPSTGVSAVVVNVTEATATAVGYLTVYPSGVNRPSTSTVNFAPGRAQNNQTTSAVGADGKINVYNSSGSTDVIVDVEGYYTSTGTQFVPLTQTRIDDTRAGYGFPNSGHTLASTGTLTVQVSGHGGVPSDATAVIADITAVNTKATGDLEAYPTGSTRHGSSLNYIAGQNLTKEATVQLGTSPSGAINIYNNSSGTTDVIVDVLGYYTNNSGGRDNAVTPTRIADTRTGQGQPDSGQPIGPGGTQTIQVTGRAGVPANATAVVVNLTIPDGTANSSIVAYPSDASAPNATTIFYSTSANAFNEATVKLSASGAITVHNSAGTIDAIVDVLGYVINPAQAPTTTTTDNYSYNAAGSTTTLPGQNMTYDSEGRAATTTLTATGTSQNDIYDANGNLLLQTDPVTGTTAFLGDTELHLAPGATTATGTRTYMLAGQTLAERDTTAGVTGSHLYFLDTNPQGTGTALIDTTNSNVTRRYFDPYGNPRGAAPTWTSINGYLNKPTNTFTGSTTAPLVELGARNYDPTIGRFLTADPVLNKSDPQGINGYSYADNNPTSRSDPSGLDPDNQGVCGFVNGCNPKKYKGPDGGTSQGRLAAHNGSTSTSPTPGDGGGKGYTGPTRIFVKPGEQYADPKVGSSYDYCTSSTLGGVIPGGLSASAGYTFCVSLGSAAQSVSLSLQGRGLGTVVTVTVVSPDGTQYSYNPAELADQKGKLAYGQALGLFGDFHIADKTASGSFGGVDWETNYSASPWTGSFGIQERVSTSRTVAGTTVSFSGELDASVRGGAIPWRPDSAIAAVASHAYAYAGLNDLQTSSSAYADATGIGLVAGLIRYMTSLPADG